MARKNVRSKAETRVRWELTPEQKVEARQRLIAQSEEAARNNVWEQFLALEGKVRLGVDADDLREDRD